jgi:adenosylhomocysteine nucleosidase
VSFRLGIVAALEMERRWITGSGPLVVVSGVGRRRAEDASRRLLDNGVTALVSWGVAGGLHSDLRAGSVILPDAVVEADGSRIGADLGWRDRLLARIDGRVATSTAPLAQAASAVTSPEQKLEMHRRTGAGAVDMESAAVAKVAISAGIPWIAVRVVVDTADVRLPEAALRVYDEEGRLKRGVVLRLVVRPWTWSGLVALGWAGVAAGRSMRRVWALTGPDLAHGWVGDR